jgi:hypothetical protein
MNKTLFLINLTMLRKRREDVGGSGVVLVPELIVLILVFSTPSRIDYTGQLHQCLERMRINKASYDGIKAFLKESICFVNFDILVRMKEGGVVVPIFDKLTQLCATSCDFVDTKQYPHLTSLDISINDEYEDGDHDLIQPSQLYQDDDIIQLKQLTTLFLHNAPKNHKQFLSNFTQLTSYTVNNMESDLDLSPLKNLLYLRIGFLADWDMDEREDVPLSCLSYLTKLERLTIRQGSDSITPINLPNLTSLTTISSNIVNTQVIPVANQLIEFESYCGKIDMNVIKLMENLEVLKITSDMNENFEELCGLTKLTVLHIKTKNRISSTTLQLLTNLKELKICNNSFLMGYTLLPLSKLEKLSLFKIPNITNICNTSITTLEIDSCRGINDDSLCLLHNLKRLKLWDTAITDNGIKTLTRLNELVYSRSQITDEGLERLDLTYITLPYHVHGDGRITPHGLSHMKNLVGITFSYNYDADTKRNYLTHGRVEMDRDSLF